MTLKLEVGKTYVNRDGNKRLVIYINKECIRDDCVVVLDVDQNRTAPFYLDGKLFKDIRSSADLIKEYKEPVVHKQEVIIMRRDSDGFLNWLIQKEVGVEMSFSRWAGWTCVHRSVVTYMEE